MHANQPKKKIVKRVSVCFKNLMASSDNASKTCESMPSTPEKQYPSNCQSRPKVLYVSLNSLLKENRLLKPLNTHTSARRQRIKQLSVGYKLKKESLSFSTD